MLIEFSVYFRQSRPSGFGIANILLFKKVRKAIGFDRCQAFFTGAAPITKDTLDYFYSLNIPICCLYGMSENTGKSIQCNFRKLRGHYFVNIRYIYFQPLVF